MFSITRNRGFQMTFANGITISVQWGFANYCDNYDLRTQSIQTPDNEWLEYGVKPSKTAEVAAWNTQGNWYDWDARPLPQSTDVHGYKTPDEVLAYMARLAALPPC